MFPSPPITATRVHGALSAKGRVPVPRPPSEGLPLVALGLRRRQSGRSPTAVEKCFSGLLHPMNHHTTVATVSRLRLFPPTGAYSIVAAHPQTRRLPPPPLSDANRRRFETRCGPSVDSVTRGSFSRWRAKLRYGRTHLVPACPPVSYNISFQHTPKRHSTTDCPKQSVGDTPCLLEIPRDSQAFVEDGEVRRHYPRV